MRATMVAAFYLAIAPVAMGQSAPTNTGDDVLMVRISADGNCYFLNTSAPCEELGAYLLSMHLAQEGELHLGVDKFARYELVAATLESLERAGLKVKVGFVHVEPSQ
jgi:biopolymer transport protein ExbD